MTAFEYDAIVVGSGFGGSVLSCRLSEKGYKVCLLERGREWKMHEFPRRIHEMKQKLFWDTKNGKYGLMEFRDYQESDLMSLSASGLGGGSLIYASVMMRMPPDFFQGWPGNLSREVLDPCYDRAIEMLEASPYPFESNPYYRDTPKTEHFKTVAEKLEPAEDAISKPQFVFPDLAVRFKGDFPGHQSLNRHGALQSSCIKCGECDLGCNFHAKNTLDLNYIQRGRSFGLEVRTDSEVETVRAIEGGYEVTYCCPWNRSQKTTLRSRKVVVSAGSLNTTALLLRMKRAGHLPNLSKALGTRWCGNGDLEGTVLGSEKMADPTKGPVITGAIQYRFQNYPDGFAHGLFIQDAGFPIGMGWYLAGKVPSIREIGGVIAFVLYFVKGFFNKIFRLGKRKHVKNVGLLISKALDRDRFIRHSFVLLGMGRDRSDGKISLRADGEPVISWHMEKSQLHYDRNRREMKRIASALGGQFLDNPLTHLDKIIAVHPLGGCPMADSAQEGVVGTNGEVFGHPGLYVADASIIPTSVGPNPSLTITALSEYIAQQMPEKHGLRKKEPALPARAT